MTVENEVERQVAQVGSRVELVNTKLDGMSQLIDERWKSMEQRMDMNARQQQQSIELLTSAFTKLETNHQHNATELAEARRDGSVLRAEFNDLKNKVEMMQSNVKSIVQLVIAGGITLASSVAAVFLTTPHH